MIFIDFIQGFIIGLSLIIAIGPQNLFVIRQGLIKNYIFIVCLICSLSDSLLIIIGITLSSYLINISSIFVTSLKIIGSLWLIIYGILKIKNAITSEDIEIEVNKKIINNVVIATLALTFLNPHVYLDTIVLIGSIALNFENKISFGLGVILSSFVFFFSLGYFSQFLSRFIKSKRSWFWIDSTFGLLMIVYGIFFFLKS